MRIVLVTPAPPRSRYGNRVTALRWAGILRSLGHRVRITQEYDGEPCDVLVALHARRSYRSISRFHSLHPKAPIILALTGTDLYHDLGASRRARESLELATRVIVLQPKALEALPPGLRRKTRVIYQSVKAASRTSRPSGRGAFHVCVIGYLRPVKDPFRAALAARSLPGWSRIRIVHVGAARTQAMAARARAESKVNPRYRWLGERSRESTLGLLAGSRLMVLSSRMEGGANVLSEAIVAGTPVIASRIPGTIGILGADYPGYFAAGDTRGLARLLLCTETDAGFLAALKAWCKKRAPLFHPAREKRSWAGLLAEITETGRS